MRSFTIAAVCAVLSISFVAATGCDQLNKPFPKASSSSSSSSGGSSATTDADAGDPLEGGAPAPAITAEPGDIQL